MKNASIIEIIKDKFAEQQMSAEYRLQLTNVVELEDKFTKDFDKDKWKEYFNLDLAKGALFNIDTGNWRNCDNDELVNYTITHEFGHYVQRVLQEKSMKTSKWKKKYDEFKQKKQF